MQEQPTPKRTVLPYSANPGWSTMPKWKKRSVESRQPRPRMAFSALRDFVYIRDAGQCQYCGALVSYNDCNIDHVVPWPHGQTEGSNLVVACKPCNKLKGRAVIPLELRPIPGSLA